jgi:hypothetical protein
MNTAPVPLVLVLSMLLAIAVPARPDVTWADWTAATVGVPGTAAGALTFPGPVAIGVSYIGNVAFAQTAGGENFWSPTTPYISPTVPNAPPASDLIAMTGGNLIVNTITFSAPVLNPVMAVLTLGRSNVAVTYNFDQPFDVLSTGAGYWGNGTFSELSGNKLEGAEGHGVIQFNGTFSEITWTVPVAEFWHGFTVGAQEPGVTSVPEGNSMAFLLSGLLPLGLAARKRARSRNL